MRYLKTPAMILGLGIALGVVSSLGKSLPHASFFHWNGTLLFRCVAAILVLGGIPATVCAMTRRARSAWLPVAVLMTAMLIAPWVDFEADRLEANRFGPRDVIMRASDSDSMLWEPLVLAGILVIPTILMRRFVPAFHAEALTSQ
jgi:hypothetical protein